MKAILFLLLIFLDGSLLFCQPIIPRFENLGVNDGLSHNSVYSIHQDKRGYMWFGTPNGLCRYDGSRFQTFQFFQNDKNISTNNFVRGEILEDSSGNIWYSNESGLYKWDKASEKVMLEWGKNLLENNPIQYRTLIIDQNNQLWLSNIRDGFIKYDLSSGRITKFPFPFKINYSNLLHAFIKAENKKKIWLKIGDEKALMMTFDVGAGTFSEVMDYENVNNIFFDNRQKMLVYKNKIIIEEGSDNLARVNGSSVSKSSHPFDFICSIKDVYGRWWLTSSHGLSCYDENKKVLSVFLHDNLKLKSLPFDVTTCVYIDRNNNLWIGTDGGGIARLDLKQPRFNIFPLSMGDFPVLKDYFTKCIFEDEQQRIWFGTYSSGLNIYDPKKGTLVNFKNNPQNKNSLPGNIVGAILRDKDNNMWIGTNVGLSILNEKKGTFKNIPIKNFENKFPGQGSFINKIIQLKSGGLLCATTRGLLVIKRKSSRDFSAAFIDNVFSSSSIDVLQLKNGNIYLAQPTWGIFEIKQNGENIDSINRFLVDIDIRSISADHKNEKYLWVASGIGLIHYNLATNKYRLYNENDGLADHYIYGALDDSKGNLWVSTNKGLSFLNTKTQKFDNYSHLHGLQSNEFNTQSFYKSGSGYLYFGGVNGFNWFNENAENKRGMKPQAAITSIEINNTPFTNDTDYMYHQKLSVPYYENDFIFNFAALDFTLPNANKIKYQLEGWDEFPVITENKTARYSNLPPGIYQLTVKVSNADGVWSDEIKNDIVVRAPYWKTKPFLAAFYILLLLLVIYATYFLSRQKGKKRIRLLEKQVAINAERLRISADMHDEIGSSITHIALLSEIVQSQNNGESKKEMKMISNSAQRLVQSIGEIIWALNPQNDTLENLLAYMREQSQQYFEPFEKNFSIDFPEEVLPLKLTNEVRRNLYLVTKELLNNALKHANASEISLRFIIENGRLLFTVRDNGCGISESKKRMHGNGLRNLTKRMNDIGGTIIWLNKFKGTEVNYTMPLNRHTTLFTSNPS